VSDDPRVHIENVLKLRESGATDVFIHSGQYDQQRVIDFYSRNVLPEFSSHARAA
jgi:hypothetical protein